MVTIFGLKVRLVNDFKLYFGDEIFREIEKTKDIKNNTCDVVLNRRATLIYSGNIVTIDFKDLTLCLETNDFHYVAIS